MAVVAVRGLMYFTDFWTELETAFKQ